MTPRESIAEYIRSQAKPVEKFSHQPRLYAVARLVGDGLVYDDDVLYAAAWLHDLGVFYGHRPEDTAELVRWDNVRYALEKIPALLEGFGFPPEKVAAVLHAVETHQPSATPQSVEAVILRDADILEQLGAVGILRTVCKTGRDTRFHVFSDAVASLERALSVLPPQLRTATARRLAEPRVQLLRAFLEAARDESQGVPL